MLNIKRESKCSLFFGCNAKRRQSDAFVRRSQNEIRPKDFRQDNRSEFRSEAVNFLSSVSDKKEGATLASQSTIRNGLPFLVLCYKHNCVCLTVIPNAVVYF